jgi:hypothetical protein
LVVAILRVASPSCVDLNGGRDIEGFMNRPIYTIKNRNTNGVLVDILPDIVDRLGIEVPQNLQWTIFGLRWVQRMGGLLRQDLLETLSEDHTTGLRLNANGMAFFLSEVDQLWDGIFLADSQNTSWEKEMSIEDLLRRSQLGIYLFDTTFWQVSSAIESIDSYARFIGASSQ